MLQTKRPRGRPRKGQPLPARLDDEERMTAELLGNGVAAEGVRIALACAKILGEENARQLVLAKQK